MTALSPLGTAALAYAARGWPVFPLRPRGKVPLVPKAAGGNGVHDATTDVSRVERWWTKRPEANIGLACGRTFWVLDEDDGGAATLEMVRDRFGPLPRTICSRTGSGGRHFLWAADARIVNSTRFLPGLDTRATGGYVVAPPSVHPDTGAEYGWIVGPDEASPAVAPDWLIALCEPLEDEEPPPRTARPAGAGNVVRYAEAALAKACDAIEAAAPGTQCDRLDHEAYGIGRLVAGGVIPLAVAEAALVDAGCRMRAQAGRRPWNRREVAYRVTRAFTAGARDPRVPENAR